MAAKNKNKNQDLSGMSREALLNTISETESRLRKMQFSHAITPIENPMNIRITRRENARLKTQLKKTESGL